MFCDSTFATFDPLPIVGRSSRLLRSGGASVAPRRASVDASDVDGPSTVQLSSFEMLQF
jgi:hypothetical protein